MCIKLIVLSLADLLVCLGNRTNVMYPMLSPIRAPVFCNSMGGSLWENNTWGAVCEARLPSRNSCMNTFPKTTSSSSLNTVLKTTVTRSACASTYLSNKKWCENQYQINQRQCEIKSKQYLQSLIFPVLNHCPRLAINSLFLKLEILFEY